jgi:signal peptide peptidase SppA
MRRGENDFMKLAQIYSVLKTEPLFCKDGYRETLLEMFEQHASMSAGEFKHARTGKARSGSDLEVEQMEVVDGIARIPVGGPIGQGLGEFEKGAGAVDVDDIAAELDEAEEDEEVKTIILNFDSPGGMVSGTPELGTRILAVEKPIYAWSRGHMCSAAYWLGCCTNGVFCSPTATIGSIGVCMSFMDMSKMADMAGIKVKVFGSGLYKGMGTPGTSLTPRQEILIEEQIKSLAGMFYSHVREQRGAIEDSDMQGQTFDGQSAMDKGFVDGIMTSLADLEAFLR